MNSAMLKLAIGWADSEECEETGELLDLMMGELDIETFLHDDEPSLAYFERVVWH